MRNAATTRDKLLESARRRFLEESYDNAGLRDIARDAGVDVSLVGRYFGNKEELFRAVLRKDDKHWEELAQAEDVPSYLANLCVSDAQQDAEHIERLLIMLRSAASPTAANIVRSVFNSDVIQPMAKILGGPEAEPRAAMALSILMGTTIVRTIMRLEKAYECQITPFRQRLTALLEVALASGDKAPGGACSLVGEDMTIR